MSDELKPCPFCGKEAATHEVGFPYHYWDVWCDGECFEHFCEKPTEAEAVEAWNTRTPENIGRASEWRYCPHCGRKMKVVDA